MELGNINNVPSVPSRNRNALVLVIILAVLIIILLGVLYFTRQRNMGEVTPAPTTGEKVETHSLKELQELTSAPENNPDIQPNPNLTAMTSVAETEASAEIVDSGLMDKLTAPNN